ncbi:hypothetical protein [Campylobacter majalis]|uniref:hypothetical protein n=1 Tax=Campylobacter majalis TaxID=2790656 RepID=UPI001E4CCF4F|nr:hypothetical protein [Campylobacter majalis]
MRAYKMQYKKAIFSLDFCKFCVKSATNSLSCCLGLGLKYKKFAHFVTIVVSLS